MAGDWIKVRVDIFDDPAVLMLSDTLGIDCPTLVGHLVMFWSWVGRHTTDGNGLKITRNVIDRRIGVPGFADALISVGWLDGLDMDMTIPLFDRHNGDSAKARALEAEAKRLRRKGKSDDSGSGPDGDRSESGGVGHLSDKKVPKSPTRGEERRGEKITSSSTAAPVVQLPVQDDRFPMAAEWVPGPSFQDCLTSEGIAEHWTRFIDKFVLYWRGQPAKAYNQPGWEKKFVDWIAREIDQREARLR